MGAKILQYSQPPRGGFCIKAHFYATIIIQMVQFVNGFFAKKSNGKQFFLSQKTKNQPPNTSAKRRAVSGDGGAKGRRYSAWQSPFAAMTCLTGMGLLSQNSACIPVIACFWRA
jgi:hypothetical protein